MPKRKGEGEMEGAYTTSHGMVVAGDCLKAMQGLEPGSIDLAFADPPFNIGYEYDIYRDDKSAEDYLGWSKSWMAEVRRVLKPGGAFWLAIGDEFAAELKVIASRDIGFKLRSWVVWHYTFGVHQERKFTRSHAHLFYFVAPGGEWTFDADAIRVPSARQLVYKDARANPKGRVPDDTWILRPQDAPEAFSADSDTWHIPRVNGTFKERLGWHPCQLPERILARIILACSAPDDTVLDPFGGSGTTAVVATKLGRRFLITELSPNYAQLAADRIAKVKPGDAIIGGEMYHVNKTGK